MLFALPRKGFAHEHGSKEMINDLSKLEYYEVALKCDGELARAEGKRRPFWATLELGAVSPMGGRGNGGSVVGGAGESPPKRVGRPVGYQRAGAASVDGVVGRARSRCIAERNNERKALRPRGWEIGETVHFKSPNGSRRLEDKLEGQWGEGFLLGRY